MTEKSLIIYHAPCADGLSAAWVARQKFPDAEFYPTAHHKEPPDVTNKHVYILDYAYPRDVLLKMLDQAASLTVLDHHESNQKILDGLIFCKFDMKRSGAGITWDTLFPKKPRLWIIDYVEDRDLWTWRLPFSKEVSAALDSYPQNFDTWDMISQRRPEDLAAEGGPIIRYENQMISKILSSVREVEFEGYKVPTVNSPTLISEIGSQLAIGRPFSIVWRQTSNGKYAYSLRSTDAGVNVANLAALFGGGGHRCAAGLESNTLLI